MSTEDLEANIRPRTGCAILAVPIVMAAILIGGYGALLLASFVGNPPTGEVTTISFVGCDEARPFVEARVATMGLGDPAWADTVEGFDLTARMPEDLEIVSGIVATLAARGDLVVRGGSGPDAPVLATRADVTDTLFRVDLTASPRVGITLAPEAAARVAAHAEAHPEATTTVWIDGDLALDRPNGPGLGWDRLDLGPQGENAEVVAKVAGWATVLEHGPLPCDLAIAKLP